MNHFPEKEQYQNISLAQVTPAGWMKHQMTNDLQNGFAGCLDELSPRASSNIFSKNRVRSFEKTEAGMINDTPRTWWSGETEAVWLDGFVRMAYLSGDQQSIFKADNLIQALLDSQDNTGYIGIYTEDCRFQHKKENGEFWTQSRAMVALLAHYEFTGQKENLDAVEKAIALTMEHYGPERSYFRNETPAGGTGHGLMLVDVLEWLYRLTGNDTYRDYGIWCYQDYCSADGIRDVDNHLDRLLRLDEGFHWHTPHTTEHLRVPLWVSYMTADPEHLQAAENAFIKIQRYLVPSGSCIGDERIQDRQPTADIPYEYCSTTELLTSLLSACQKTGLAAFGDAAEWVAFNAAQGSRLSDGTGISYLTRDNRLDAVETEHGGRMKFSPTHEDVAVCCNPNAVKLLPYYTNRMWFKLTDTEGICAFCYGPSELNTIIRGKSITIKEETEYPFSETIDFTIQTEVPLEFEIRLRIPGWATGTDISVEEAEAIEENGFLRIRKTWKTNDTLKIMFQCSIEAYESADNTIAVRRGPLLYALPIPGTRKILKEYGIKNLNDFSVTPKEPIPEYSIDPDNLDFILEAEEEPDTNIPWDKPFFHLKGTMFTPEGDKQPVKLLPLGCTLLRRTTFPRL